MALLDTKAIADKINETHDKITAISNKIYEHRGEIQRLTKELEAVIAEHDQAKETWKALQPYLKK